MARKFLGGKPTVGSTDVPVVIESRTITATAPVTIAGTTSADLSADRTIAVTAASTSAAGVVQLSDSTSTNASTKAATEKAVYDTKLVADGAVPKSTVTTAGDLIVATGSGAVTRLGAGTSGAALVSTGTTSAPAYSTTINGTAIPSSATLVTTARTITTTAPLRIAAGASADLSADRTLSINNFTGDSGSGGAAGAVPAPASGDAAAGKFLKADGTWTAPSGSGGSTYVAEFSKAGTIATGTGTFRWYNDSGATRTIGTVRASVGTAPTGASLIVDVNVSASGAAPATIYSTQANRPSIAASAFTATGSTKSTTTIANGDYFTVDIDQVGSTIAGSDLTVLIWLT